MPFEFIEKRKAAENKELATARDRYVMLVRKMAANELTKKEETELSETLVKLAIPLAQLEADALAISTYNDLTTEAGKLTDGQREQESLSTQLAALVRETDAYVAGQQQKIQAMRGQLVQVNARIDKAEKAAEQMAEIGRKHWSVLGLENPEVTDRRAHLVQTVFIRPARCPHALVEFEGIMSGAENSNLTLQWLERVKWTPVEGQTQEDLDDLVERARLMIMERWPSWYLMAQGISIDNLANKSRVAQNNGHDPYATSLRFERLPGQSQDELDQLVEDLKQRTEAVFGKDRPVTYAGR